MAEKFEKSSKKTSVKRKEADLFSGRIPPHSIEMERAILCAALVNPMGFTKIVDFVDANSFYDRRNQMIFSAMENLSARNAPIDALTVSEELGRNGQLEAIGGDPFLGELTYEITTAVHAEEYARTVREKASLRQIIISATNTAIDAYESPDSSELLERVLHELFNIYTNKQQGGFQPIGRILSETYDYLEKHKGGVGNLTGVGTGFSELDEITSGFQNGDLIVIAGRPSMGKTAFSLDLAVHACITHNVPVAYFSMEMASMAIALRLLAASSKINLHKLRSGKVTKSQWKNLALAEKTLSESKLFIDDSGTLGLMELRARARQLKQQHDIGIIFLDYLQLMKPPKADSREQEVAQISRALKGLARELNIPVIAMSQLSRAVEQRGGDKRPQLSDLRDSGAIEQDADVVMFIYRKRQYESSADNSKDEEGHVELDNTAEIIIRKQRNGPTGTVKLTFLEDYAHFESQSDKAALETAATYRKPPGDQEEEIPF